MFWRKSDIRNGLERDNYYLRDAGAEKAATYGVYKSRSSPDARMIL
jgi:hypothetical protein